MSHSKGDFSPWRAYFWPIHRYELRKFLPLLVMAFFIGFNYNILRNMKEAFLVTAADGGAEVIPFLKVWGIVPGALVLTFIYSRLNNRLSRNGVFYAMISIFLGFFALFTFCVYPIQSKLHPHAWADFLQIHLPAGCKGLIAMFRYWTFSSFYIMSELWSSTILSMLFWGFANEVTRVGEAKRFYGFIAIGLNMAAITSGQVSVFLTSSFLRTKIAFGQTEWHQSVVLLTGVILLSGLAILGIFRYMTQAIVVAERKDPSLAVPKPKVKISMRESFQILARSKYLLSLAVIVLTYNLVINLVEVVWKDQVCHLYPNPNDYNAYMSQITTITGIIAFFASFLFSGQLIRKYGWTAGALVTPVILLITCAAFFFFFFGYEWMIGFLPTMFGITPLSLVVFLGSMQNCLSRAAKFTLFDSTKEIAFIPLSREDKLRGKAAIDGVGSRLGKSGGSLIHQILLVVFTTISASAHIVAGILLVAILFWIGAVMVLGKQFNFLSVASTADAPSPLPAKSKETVAIH